MATDTAPVSPGPSVVPGGAGVPDRGLRPAGCWFLGAAVAAACGAVSAGDWTITPRAAVSETYSDNVGLAPEGREQHDFVTDTTAGISVHGRGRRLTLHADYNLQHLLYLRGSGANGINHQWQVLGEAEVVEQTGFIEFRTTMSQENASNVGRFSESRVNTGARRDVLTMSVSPVVRHRFGSFATSEGRLTYDRVTNDARSGKTTSESYGASAFLASGARFPRTPWSLAVNTREVTNTDDSKSTFSSVDGRVSYVISRKWTADFGAGIDRNDFASGSNRDDGIRWRAGATWTPSARTRISAGYEKRFFDDTYFLDLFHRSRRTRWSVSYDESVTTTRQLQLERVLVALVDPFGEPLPDPVTGEPILLPIDFAVPTDEVIVNRRLNGTMAVTGRRTTASVSAFRSERTFQISNDEETILGARARITRTMSSRLSASGGLSWRTAEGRAGGGEEVRWSVDAGLSYEVGPSATGRLTYRYTRQEDDAGVNDFEENQFVASLNLRF